MQRRSEEEGYWDAMGDEDEGSHLFWVPAHLHPEIAPSEFRAYLKEHARASDDGHEPDKPLPYAGPARALSTGVARKKSMLSRQYKGGDEDEAPVRRSRSSVYGGPQLTINDLQKIDELAQDADPAKLRAVLRRSLSLNVAPSFLDKADALPDTDEADSPIIVPRPGQILRRAARTKIRKPNLPGDGGGHRFASTRRNTRQETRSESDHSHSHSHEQPLEQLLPPDDDWSSDRPLSYTDESTIFDAYADRRDSMTSLGSEDPKPVSLDIALGIPAPVVHPVEPLPDPEPEPEPEPEPAPEPELYHPAPQRLEPPPEPILPQRTPSPAASPASSDLHLPTQQHQSQPNLPSQVQQPRKEKKGGLFGMGKKSKKDKDKEDKDKDPGFFGSLFGGRKKPDEPASFTGNQAAAAALLGASKSKSPAPTYPNQPPIQPSANGTYARYPIHVERAVYRLSHIKLANPRRPLYEQVLISNLMFWYLGVINKAQQEEKERAAEKEREEREKKEKEKRKVQNGARKAEMPVRGPQYEMQNRQMAEEYPQQRPQSAPPERQYHLPVRQQSQPPQSRTSMGDAEFGYSVPVNGGNGGLPPGAMAPQDPHSPTSPNSLANASYGSSPYPPVARPKSAGKASGTGSLGSKRSPKEEDDVPLGQLGGSLGRRAR